jgi:hypothetical protein
MTWPASLIHQLRVRLIVLVLPADAASAGHLPQHRHRLRQLDQNRLARWAVVHQSDDWTPSRSFDAFVAWSLSHAGAPW